MSFSGYIVKVLFDDFLLEDGYPCDDVLTFYDGTNETSSLLGSYCGTIHPEVIYSTGQYLYVKFVTDNIIKYKGFKFSVTAVKAGTVFQWFIHCNVYRELVSLPIGIKFLCVRRILVDILTLCTYCIPFMLEVLLLHALLAHDTSQCSPMCTSRVHDDRYSDYLYSCIVDQ